MNHSPLEHEKGSTNRDDTSNPAFPSLLNFSEDSARPNFFESTPYRLHGDTPSDEALRKIRTANSVSISPELFEKIYLSPQNAVKGDLRSKFGNPTPLALLGFLLTSSPLSCELMGWRNSAGGADVGIANVGSYYFIGGLLMMLGGILEFFLGNTFSFVVFCSFGGFWFTLGSTLTPSFNAFSTYGSDNFAGGLQSPGFQAAFGFFFLFVGLLCLVFLVCALRTNVVFVAIFLGLFMTFVLLTASYWHHAIGHHGLGEKLQFASGAFCFMAAIAGWWIFLAQMLASVDFPFQLPVGDISHVIKGGSTRLAEREQFSA